MNNVLYKIVVIGMLSLVSVTANSTIMMGNLSYDDTGTHTFTGINGGKSYVGWGETLFYSYEDTLALTEPGQIYEGYYLATMTEAAEFFTLATGVDVDLDTEFESAYLSPSSPNLYGENDTTFGIMAGDEGLSYLFKSNKDEWGNQLIGRVTLYGYVDWMTYHATTNSNTDSSDGWQDGMTTRSHTTWLMVPAPNSVVVFVIALISLGFNRKFFKNK